MELWQILAIVLGSLFIVTFLAFIIVYARNKKREEELAIRLAKMYADPNLARIDYDFAVYDEDEQLIAKALSRNGQSGTNAEDEQQLSFLGSNDNEGIEEITGNYKP